MGEVKSCMKEDNFYDLAITIYNPVVNSYRQVPPLWL